MDIVVKGRNVEVPEHYRVHVADKLRKIERYDHKLIRVDVELHHERNPRQSDHCQRVEITCSSRGPVVRAEACAKDFYTALDNAITKLDTRLRRVADRRRVHRGRHAPVSVAAATAGLPVADLDIAFGRPAASPARANGAVPSRPARLDGSGPAEPGYGDDADPDGASATDQYDENRPWNIVREKEHAGAPMAVEDALFQMELVGHDFFLFLDKESGRPSVVYRRKGYDYGVISLAA